jgi:hypothetical protein
MLAAVPFGLCGTDIGDYSNHTHARIKIERRAGGADVCKGGREPAG